MFKDVSWLKAEVVKLRTEHAGQFKDLENQVKTLRGEVEEVKTVTAKHDMQLEDLKSLVETEFRRLRQSNYRNIVIGIIVMVTFVCLLILTYKL